MTIRFPANSGTEMRKKNFLLVLLAALLYLVLVGGVICRLVGSDGLSVFCVILPALGPARLHVCIVMLITRLLGALQSTP